MKLVYRFVVKSYSSSSLFSWIDLLFFTKVDGRIMPRLRCSCSLSYGGSKMGGGFEIACAHFSYEMADHRELQLCTMLYYAPVSKDWGHTVFGLSVLSVCLCLSVCLSAKTLTLAISFEW
jgi:hypothetical protein